MIEIPDGDQNKIDKRDLRDAHGVNNKAITDVQDVRDATTKSCVGTLVSQHGRLSTEGGCSILLKHGGILQHLGEYHESDLASANVDSIKLCRLRTHTHSSLVARGVVETNEEGETMISPIASHLYERERTFPTRPSLAVKVTSVS